MERRDLLKMAAGVAALLVVPAAASAEPTSQTRTVEVYVRGRWRKGTWAGLKKDMIFRLREGDGSIADEGTEHEVCVAVGNSYPMPGSAICGIKAETFTFIDQSHVLAPRLRVMKNGWPVGMVRMVDMKRGLMHRSQRQAEIPLADMPVLALIAEVESFDYVELLPV